MMWDLSCLSIIYSRIIETVRSLKTRSEKAPRRAMHWHAGSFPIFCFLGWCLTWGDGGPDV